jgi:methyl-accepting chemotaxis protein
LEDALKKLDKLTNEEAWMGIAQNLKATHTVGKSVKRVAEEVVAIDNRVAGVDERVVSVGDKVASVDKTVKGVDDRVANVDDRVRVVDDRVANVDERVRVVDDRVTEVIRGASIIFNQSPSHTYCTIWSTQTEER